VFFPKPPLESEKYNYALPNSLLFAVSGILLLIGFSISILYFINKSIYLIPYLFFCLIYIFNTAFCSIGSLFAKDFDLLQHDEQKELNINYVPSVDIYLPNCGESIELLTNSFNYISKIEYPNYKVWVLDDMDRTEVKELAEKYNFEYIARENKGYLKKAGNMRNAFTQTNGELILVFDADFVPRSDFLAETVHYFIDEKIGILQTPQGFQSDSSQTDIEQGATYLQEVFYKLIQNFRDTWGFAVCTGSCAIYRRKALEPFGGAYPVERSEDVNTGLSILRTGWKIKYIPLLLSNGLSPNTIKGFFHQQYRWCSGSLHLITSELFWQQDISILGKMNYFLSILYYLSSGLGTILFVFPSLINIWFYPEDFSITNYSLIVPALSICFIARGMWANNKWGVHVALTSFTAAYCHLTAIIDTFTGNVAPWIPTGAAESVKLKRDNFKYFKNYALFIPMLLLSLFLGGLYYNRGLINLESHNLGLIVSWYISPILLQYYLFSQIWVDELTE
jgi:cellulose synthase/poly-beta-1,6-N-acetylglucosamine synthase-like glycosyltransferase